MLLRQCAPGTVISFPGKRRKYKVRDHAKPYLEVLENVVNGKNYTVHSGTHLYNSSGRIIHVKSNREVIVY